MRLFMFAGKLLYLQGGAFLAYVYLVATNSQKYSVNLLNKKNPGRVTQETIMNLDYKRSYDTTDIILDFASGDIYTYMPEGNRWVSSTNCGLHKTNTAENDLRSRNQVINHAHNTYLDNSNVRTSNKGEKIICVETEFISHWITKDISNIFIAFDDSNWEMHEIIFKAPECRFNIVARCKRGPRLICSHNETVVCALYRVDEEYPETITILKNFLRIARDEATKNFLKQRKRIFHVEKLLGKQNQKEDLISERSEKEEDGNRDLPNFSVDNSIIPKYISKDRKKAISVDPQTKNEIPKASGYCISSKYRGRLYLENNSIEKKTYFGKRHHSHYRGDKMQNSPLKNIMPQIVFSKDKTGLDDYTITKLKEKGINKKRVGGSAKHIIKPVDKWVPGYYSRSHTKRFGSGGHRRKQLVQEEIDCSSSNSEGSSKSKEISPKSRRDPQNPIKSFKLFERRIYNGFITNNPICELKSAPRFFTKFKARKKLSLGEIKKKKYERLKVERLGKTQKLKLKELQQQNEERDIRQDLDTVTYEEGGNLFSYVKNK